MNTIEPWARWPNAKWNFQGAHATMFEGFERWKGRGIAAVRSTLIILAQVHLAVSDVEIESGQRWLKSLVSLSVDDEIEMFIENVEERAASGSRRILEDEYDAEGGKDEYEESEMNVKEAKTTEIKSNAGLYSNTTLTTSESDLLRIGTPESKIHRPFSFKGTSQQTGRITNKLGHQLEALERCRKPTLSKKTRQHLKPWKRVSEEYRKKLLIIMWWLNKLMAKLSEIQDVEEVKIIIQTITAVWIWGTQWNR